MWREYAASACRAAVRLCAASVMAASLALAPTTAAQAQGRSVSLIRDAEIEALVRDYAEPILRAAGLASSGIEIVLVNEQSFNAFVAGRRIFINTGALMASETPNEIIGVIAHEAGHIAGGHQARLREQMARAQVIAAASMILGLGAAAAGASTDTPGLAQGGVGLAMAGGDIARRGLLAYQRTEEATADRSALTYLERTGQSAEGMLATFERLAGDLALSGVNVDPYQISHPMPRERIANLAEAARQSPHFGKRDSASLQQRHDLMRAKIAAYAGGRGAPQRLFRDDPRGAPALYADAIATFLSGRASAALPKIDALVQAAPNNPYFHEMRGEILMKANRPADAANAFARALALDPNTSGMIQIGYGQALLATGTDANVRQAVSELQTGLSRAGGFGPGYRYLAQAHARLGHIGEADLATAEGHYVSGNLQEARIFATRAQQRMQRGSPGWLRAQDIINQKPG